MPDDASIDALHSLRDRRPIETLETIEPAKFTRADIGTDAIVRAVDPAELDTCGVRRLLEAIRGIGTAVPSVDLERAARRSVRTDGATPAVLFVTGKLTVKGDLGFAAGLIRYFDLPSPRR